MITIKHLSKTFSSKKGDVKALKDINTTFQNRGMVFLLGKSGSGKSTFLNLLAGFDKPSQGEILFKGKDIASFTDKELQSYNQKDMGFIFQNYCLLENLTVQENIALGIEKDAKACLQEIRKLLKEVSLEGYEKKLVKQLSGGEKQRVAIARALIKDPYVLYCDEPTGNLDGISSKLVMDILKERSKSCLVLVVTHNVSLAYEYAQRVLQLKDGILYSDKSYSISNKKQNTIYLSNIDEMKKEELEEVNQKLHAGNDFLLDAKRNLFSDTKEKKEDFLKEKENKKTSFHASIKSIFKEFLLFDKKSLVFSLLISLCFSMFACLSSIYRGGLPSLAFEALEKEKINYCVIESTRNNNIFPFADKDYEILNQNGYPLYKMSLSIIDQAPKTWSGKMNASCFNHFYADEAKGVLVTDESFLKKILKVDEISFLCKADEEKSYGVYISDYLADSILHFNDNIKDYKDICGSLKNTTFLSNGQKIEGLKLFETFINGIIKTDYQNKTKTFQKSYDKGGFDYQSNKESALEYDYISNALSTCYSLNADFKRDYDDQLDIQTLFYAGKYRLDSSVSGSFFKPTDKVKGNKAIMSKKKLMGFLNAKSDEELNTLLKAKNEAGGFTLEDTLAVPQTGDSAQEEKTYHIEIEYSEDEEVTQDFYTSLFLSEELFKKIRSDQTFCYAYYGNLDSEMKKTLSKLDPDSYWIHSFQDTFNYYSQIAYSTFGDTMGILALFLLILFFVLVLFYILSLIKSQVYNYGVYKAMGIKNQKIFLSYLLYTLCFVLISGLFMAAAYLSLAKSVNHLFIEAVFHLKGNSPLFHETELVYFNWRYYFLGIAGLFLLLYLIGISLSFFKMKNNAISKLKNKE